VTVWRDGQVADEHPSAPMWVGWGVFTTAGCDHGRVLLWKHHAARLARSLATLGADPDVALPDRRTLETMLERDGLDGPARLRVVVRRRAPDAPWSVEASAVRVPCGQVGPDAPPQRLRIVRWEAAPPLTGHKTLARLAWDHARETVRAQGADDALLVDAAGRLLETSVANVFVRLGERLLTPLSPGRCLPGVMRGWLLSHAVDLGFEVVEADVTLGELEEADEVWLTNAVLGVRRVGSVDDRTWRRWDGFARLRTIGLPAPGWPAS
jgi:branched-subunit amino acid aminotransferase/4-amino-4-deoxychorismate lyase